jgi:hypothetical protein
MMPTIRVWTVPPAWVVPLLVGLLVVAGFTAATGIKVELRSGGEAELANQILQEGAASPADVFAAALLSVVLIVLCVALLGLQTLATQFWVYTSGLAYGAAALMVAVSALPTYLLTRRIDSLST